MDNRRYTPDEIERIRNRKKAIERRKRQKEYRKTCLILQIIVLLLVSGIVSALIFIPGSGSLVSGQAFNPGVLGGVSEVSAIEKPDYSFMITKLTSEINSRNAILLDLASGQILAEKFPDEKIAPASLTKMMTAIVVIEHYEDLEIMIEMPNDMYTYLIEQNASVAGFLAGEKVKILDLLYGVLLPSGADACISLARSVAGTEANFAKLMTEKAHQIGAQNTNFVNSTGLDDENHYTTVRDLSKILSYGLQNSTFRSIFTAKSHTTSPTNKHPHGITVYNTTFKAFERAGLDDPYVKGGKTGFTGNACLCLASLAMKNGREYILVTVGAGNSNSSKGTQHVKDASLIYSRYT